MKLFIQNNSKAGYFSKKHVVVEGRIRFWIKILISKEEKKARRAIKYEKKEISTILI